MCSIHASHWSISQHSHNMWRGPLRVQTATRAWCYLRLKKQGERMKVQNDGTQPHHIFEFRCQKLPFCHIRTYLWSLKEFEVLISFLFWQGPQQVSKTCIKHTRSHTTWLIEANPLELWQQTAPAASIWVLKNGQMDSEGVWQTDKYSPTDSDLYLLTVLNAMALFGAKESPDLFQFHSCEVCVALTQCQRQFERRDGTDVGVMWRSTKKPSKPLMKWTFCSMEGKAQERVLGGNLCRQLKQSAKDSSHIKDTDYY